MTPLVYTAPVYSSPEVDAAREAVDTLQDQLDNKLDKQIEAAIQRADAVEVRRLRDSRSDLEGQLYQAKVTLKEAEITFAHQQELACGAECARFMAIAKEYEQAYQEAQAQNEKARGISSQLFEAGQRFQGRFHRATQDLAEIKQAETIRMRQIAAGS